MILNRLGLNNLIEPIAKDQEFQHQDLYIVIAIFSDLLPHCVVS